MAVRFDQAELLKEAQGVVWRIERASIAKLGHVDPNFVRGALLNPFTPGDNKDSAPAPKETDDLRKLRLGELALAYVDVSDGNAKVDSSASPLARGRFENAVKGLDSDGRGFLLSQSLAMKFGKVGMMTGHVRTHYEGQQREAERVSISTRAPA